METCVRHRPDSRIQNKDLLPIREAYEWKRCVGLTHELTLQFF